MKAIDCDRVAVQGGSNYPAPFAARVAGRERQRLGEACGLRSFGVNRTRLPPGAQSALFHRHTVQEEFVYVLEGEGTLLTEGSETPLRAGMCAGFTPAAGAHQILNRSAADLVYLEVGTRETADEVEYPLDDLKVVTAPDGRRIAAHKDGTPY